MNILAVAGPGSRFQRPGARPAGFWAGVWHGLICPFTLLVCLFTPNVRIYETHNRGRLYDIGFYLGAAAALGGGGHQITPGAPQG